MTAWPFVSDERRAELVAVCTLLDKRVNGSDFGRDEGRTSANPCSVGATIKQSIECEGPALRQQPGPVAQQPRGGAERVEA